jgi:hypothetical protein
VSFFDTLKLRVTINMSPCCYTFKYRQDPIAGMKTDSLFYKLFQQAPQLVLELAGIEEASAGNYQFRS